MNWRILKTHEGSPDGQTIFLEGPRNLVHICHTSVPQLQVYSGTGLSEDHRSLNVSLKADVKYLHIICNSKQIGEYFYRGNVECLRQSFNKCSENCIIFYLICCNYTQMDILHGLDLEQEFYCLDSIRATNLDNFSNECLYLKCRIIHITLVCFEIIFCTFD